MEYSEQYTYYDIIIEYDNKLYLIQFMGESGEYGEIMDVDDIVPTEVKFYEMVETRKRYLTDSQVEWYRAHDTIVTEVSDT